MKYKVGDKVRIKSLDWYNENINEIDEVHCGCTVFIPDMVQYISDIVTISEAIPIPGIYRIKEDSGVYNWTDEMIEGLAEEETKPNTIVMKKSIYSPCRKCDARLGHYCCGCPDEKEWREWRESLSNEEWNKLVDETCKKEYQKVKKAFNNIMNRFNKLKK